MNNLKHPLIIEPAQLQQQLNEPSLVLIDLCKSENYLQGHIEGAVHLEYGKVIRVEKPVMGLLPDAQHLGQLFSSLGIGSDNWVVAYDDEGGGRAARFLWTLLAAGHDDVSLLNGGIIAWIQDQLPVSQIIPEVKTSHYAVDLSQAGLVSITGEEILDNLDQLTLLDTRTYEEYTGVKKFAEHAGHIPGAVNVNWLDAMDKDNGLRLKPGEVLQALYTHKGVTPDKDVVVYCQSHHRSAHTYFVLRHLGYLKVRGYPGSWSDWGNSNDRPFETG